VALVQHHTQRGGAGVEAKDVIWAEVIACIWKEATLKPGREPPTYCCAYTIESWASPQQVK